jgi:uncharacterized membrane protein
MILLAKILMLLVVLFLIVFPYLRKSEEGEELAIPQAQQELLFRKESAYAVIKELDFDYRMGKLSDEDYKLLRAKYEQQAISVLKQLDELGAPSAGTEKV